MASAVISAIDRCSGGNHYTFTASINGGPSRTFHVTQAELLDAGGDSTREAFLARIKSALLEADARNLSQARTALIGKTFRV